ncbi:hypothetical protein LTR94_023997, partial [Friedmanniomyces endolithicus]
MTIEDLARVRRLKQFSISPNGSAIAYAVYQALPEENRYEVRWFVQSTDARSPPRPIGVDGGQPIAARAYGLPMGAIVPPKAEWSKDGRFIAFQRQEGDRIELWVADATSLRAERVTDGQSQVDAFVWTGDGRLIWRTSLNVALFEQALQREEAHGWLDDGRTQRIGGRQRPTPPDCSHQRLDEPGCDRRVWTWSRGRGAQLGEAADAAELLQARPPARAHGVPSTESEPTRQWTQRVGGEGGAQLGLRIARLKERNGASPLVRVSVETSEGLIDCLAQACEGLRYRGLGWVNERVVWFVRAEASSGRSWGAPFDRSSIYTWTVGEDAPRRLATADLLQDCERTGDNLICLRETLFAPSHLVSVSVQTGSVTVLADPNPELAQKAHPDVRRFEVVDDEGNPGMAYLVYPNGYRPGAAYPLVVTQYNQVGFLDGQVGGEYPILPLAARGYAVLSLHRPNRYHDYRIKPSADVSQGHWVGFEDRVRMQTFISKAVDEVVREGVADPARIALTGLSNGAENTHWLLQRTDRFAAAIVSSGDYDRSHFALLPRGAARAGYMHYLSTDTVYPDDTSLLAQLSWSSRAPTDLQTPLLINVGEYE